jgi:hypothetical protein
VRKATSAEAKAKENPPPRRGFFLLQEAEVELHVGQPKGNSCLSKTTNPTIPGNDRPSPEASFVVNTADHSETLTGTPTRQRAINLCEKLRDVGLGSKRFMFTDLERIDPDNPAKILEEIFVTPKDYDQGISYGFVD